MAQTRTRNSSKTQRVNHCQPCRNGTFLMPKWFPKPIPDPSKSATDRGPATPQGREPPKVTPGGPQGARNEKWGSSAEKSARPHGLFHAPRGGVLAGPGPPGRDNYQRKSMKQQLQTGSDTPLGRWPGELRSRVSVSLGRFSRQCHACTSLSVTT